MKMTLPPWLGAYRAELTALTALNATADPRFQVRKTPSWPRSWANFSLF
jgi:hypothetical protein